MSPSVEHNLLVARFQRGIDDAKESLSALEHAKVPSGPCGASGNLPTIHHDALRTLMGGQLLLLDYRLAVLTGDETDKDQKRLGSVVSFENGKLRISGQAAWVFSIVAAIVIIGCGITWLQQKNTRRVLENMARQAHVETPERASNQ